jgi:S-adenosyl methyltransferase
MPDPAPGDPSRGDATARFDPSEPHPARVYDYWLGGKDHFAAAREAALAVERIRPQIVSTARANRHFLARVIHHMAGHGVRQFLDIGAGLPSPGGVPEIAQHISRDCRVVCADNDPVVLSHLRALGTPAIPGCGPVTCLDADVREAGYIISQAAETLDLSEPAGLLMLAILHLIPDSDDPPAIVGDLASALAPGSLVAISHMTADFSPGPVNDAVDAYNQLAPVPVKGAA